MLGKEQAFSIRLTAIGDRQWMLDAGYWIEEFIELIRLIDRNGFLQSEIRIPQSAIERLDTQ